jgi:hypothetical protein
MGCFEQGSTASKDSSRQVKQKKQLMETKQWLESLPSAICEGVNDPQKQEKLRQKVSALQAATAALCEELAELEI